MFEILLAQANYCSTYYYPPTYDYVVENNTPYDVTHQLHDQWYTLASGEYMTWNSYLGNTSVDKCGYYYGSPIFPVLELDQYPLTSYWDKKTFKLEVDLYRIMSIEETYPHSGQLGVYMY